MWCGTTLANALTATATALVPIARCGSGIPPPTREQLMAGSAKLRRVYKVET
jgi:hypothetical protein